MMAKNTSKPSWKICKIRPKQGLLIANGVKLEKHELRTINTLLWYTKRIELISPTFTPNSKNADFIMDGIVWEMKSPQGKGKQTVEHIFKKGAKQSTNLIIDLTRLRSDEEHAIKTLFIRFQNSKRVKRLMVITKTHQLLDYMK